MRTSHSLTQTHPRTVRVDPNAEGAAAAPSVSADLKRNSQHAVVLHLARFISEPEVSLSLVLSLEPCQSTAGGKKQLQRELFLSRC